MSPRSMENRSPDGCHAACDNKVGDEYGIYIYDVGTGKGRLVIRWGTAQNVDMACALLRLRWRAIVLMPGEDQSVKVVKKFANDAGG